MDGDKCPWDPWVHMFNGYFKVWCFNKNNRGNSLIRDVLVSYDR